MCCGALMSAACCAVSTVCNCLCSCCCKCCSFSLREQVKVTYIVLFSICTAFSIFVMYYLQNLLHSFIPFLNCPSDVSGQNICVGISQLLRMSFTLFTMHFIILVFCLCRGKTAKTANEGAFLLKVLYIIGMYIGLHFVSNSFFLDYMKVARVISILFLGFQSLMLVDLFSHWGEHWADIYNRGVQSCGVFLIAFTMLLYGLYIFLTYINFSMFSGGNNITLISVNISLGVIVMIMIIGRVKENGSLLTSSAVAFFSCYWLWSGMASDDHVDNNHYLRNGQFNQVMLIDIIIGGVLALVSIIYLTFQTKDNSHVLKQVNNPILLDNQERGEELDQEKQMKEQEQQQQQLQQPLESATHNYDNNNYIYFHLIMILLSFYICMMASNWGTPQIGIKTLDNLKPSQTSYWIKSIMSFFCIGLYIWTLVAPKIFPDRQF